MEYIIKGTTLQAIADAIREKAGSTETITVSAMAQAIIDIPASEDFKNGEGMKW